MIIILEEIEEILKRIEVQTGDRNTQTFFNSSGRNRGGGQGRTQWCGRKKTKGIRSIHSGYTTQASIRYNYGGYI